MYTGRGRAGVTLVELVVAMLIGGALLHLGLASLERLRGAFRGLMARQDYTSTVRIARSALRGELAAAGPGDWAFEGDSLELRAFRGRGVVCSEAIDRSLLFVGYEGDRDVDAEKDSVELVLASGEIRHAAVTSAAQGHDRCAVLGEGEEPWSWGIDPPASEEVVLVRPYERGSYGVSSSALRYRRGGGGRQPLTPAILFDGESGLVAESGVLDVRLVWREAGLERSWRGFLAAIER
jgi:hypothetical protein